MNKKYYCFTAGFIFLFLSLSLPFDPFTPENIFGINPGLNAPEALEKLGEPTRSKYDGDCRVNIYTGLFGENSTCVLVIDEDYLVKSISIKGDDPEVYTKKGIHLGDFSHKVKRIYGEPDEKGETRIEGESVYYYMYRLKNVAGRMRLYFIFKGFGIGKKVMMMVLEREEGGR